MTALTSLPGATLRLRRRRGFTLVEVLVVLAVIALLITVAMPSYLERIEDARVHVLRENLKVMRMAIDRFHADTGRYPTALEELVGARYLRELPVDPVTERADTWVVLTEAEAEAQAAARGSTAGAAPPPPSASAGTPAPGVADVRSGAEGESRNGVPYATL